MFDDLQTQIDRGDRSSSTKAWLYQAGGVVLAFAVFVLLGWAMWTYSG